jgi:hypothetical protein
MKADGVFPSITGQLLITKFPISQAYPISNSWNFFPSVVASGGIATSLKLSGNNLFAGVSYGYYINLFNLITQTILI